MKQVLDEMIASKILIVRGCKVMLDKDLAHLYGVKPIRLREQVKRNTKRFPSDFMFQLTDAEAAPWYRKMRYLLISILADLDLMFLQSKASQCFPAYCIVIGPFK